LKDYALHSVSSGTDAQGEVVVKVEDQGLVVSGKGTSTDIVEASAKAYLNALNKIISSSRGGKTLGGRKERDVMGKTLLDKVWDLHTVRELPNGQTQLFIGLHLIHEVTSPQAFQMIREKGLTVAFPERTFATADHIIPTEDQARPFADDLAEEMMAALEKNCRDFGVKYFDFKSGEQGVVHVVGPEQGLTQPGLTVACGDSHTSTHGAFGAIAFGVGTTQIRDILATQTLALAGPKFGAFM
jgi:homoaconitase/3-isopropylmalate dehydratase large subunit